MNEIVAIAVCAALFLAFGLIQRITANKKDEATPEGREMSACGSCDDPCHRSESTDAAS